MFKEEEMRAGGVGWREGSAGGGGGGGGREGGYRFPSERSEKSLRNE